ncbi:MAG: astroprincin family protein [Pseudomonadota bacterium]|nr:astroprincin family protein [Pseudomonadota bacterium]
MTKHQYLISLAVAGALALGGCSSGDDDEGDDGGDTPPVVTAACADGMDNDSDGLVDLADPGCSDATDDDETDPATAVGTVVGTISDTTSGALVPSAQVRIGDVATATDANGEFQLDDVPVGERVMMDVSAAGYETNMRVLDVLEGQTVMVSASLLPVGTMEMVDPAAGGDVSIAGSSAMVMFDAGEIDSSASEVMVTLTDVDPGSSPDNMPGDFMGMDGDEMAMIESLGAISVNIMDDAGNEVPLSNGAMATIRIPLSTRNANPDPTIPLWSFDESTGLWMREGTAQLVTENGESYYQGEVGHFSYWNADKRLETITLTGCVEDAQGEPVSGVRIKSTGVDYTGTSRARSDSNGVFRIQVRRSSELTLRGELGQAVTNTVVLNSGSSNADITNSCLRFGADNEQPFTIQLTWGETPRDLDSWLYRPEGGHISYTNRGNLESEPFANLDVDDTSSFGPEVITVVRPRVGTYRYFVDNFSEVEPGISGSPARVELTVNGNARVFTPPTGEQAGSTNYWSVFDITIAEDCSATVTPLTGDVWSTSPPERPVTPDESIPYCGSPVAIR